MLSKRREMRDRKSIGGSRGKTKSTYQSMIDIIIVIVHENIKSTHLECSLVIVTKA
jgi:hypothetical protein